MHQRGPAHIPARRLARAKALELLSRNNTLVNGPQTHKSSQNGHFQPQPMSAVQQARCAPVALAQTFHRLSPASDRAAQSNHETHSCDRQRKIPTTSERQHCRPPPWVGSASTRIARAKNTTQTISYKRNKCGHDSVKMATQLVLVCAQCRLAQRSQQLTRHRHQRRDRQP